MWAASALFIVWWLFVWFTAPVFGGDPETNCNESTVYVIFFRNVQTTAPWLRWLLVGIGAIAALLLVLSPVVVALKLMYAAKCSSADFHLHPATELLGCTPSDGVDVHVEPTENSIISWERSTAPLALTSPLSLSTPLTGTRSSHMWDQDDTWTNTQCGVTRNRTYQDKYVQFPERVARVDEAFEPVTRGVIARLLFVTYGIVMLELTIRRNNVAPGENVWSFGQIVAVVIAVGGMNEVLHFVLGKEWKHTTAEAELIEGNHSPNR
jgi:hypothetical protein